MKWITCNSCDEEFRVISDTGTFVEYCPFCGGDIINDEDEDEDYDL